MNAHVRPVISGAASPCLFNIGDFVRLKGGEIVGRVLEATKDGHTRVRVFDDTEDSFKPGGEYNFDPGCLTMWTPDVVVPSDNGPEAAPPFDTEHATDLLMKLIAVNDMAEDLGRPEADMDSENLCSHLRLLGSIVGDTACDLLDMIGALRT